MSLWCPFVVYQNQIFACTLTTSQVPSDGPLRIDYYGTFETKTIYVSDSEIGYIRESFSTNGVKVMTVHVSNPRMELSTIVNGKVNDTFCKVNKNYSKKSLF